MRVIFALKTLLLIALASFQCFAFLPKCHAEEQLFYTVQVGSFKEEKDAVGLYKTIVDKLDKEFHTALRVEYIPPYYAVRAGQCNSSKECAPLVNKLKKSSFNGYILKAFIRESRIVVIHQPQKIEHTKTVSSEKKPSVLQNKEPEEPKKERVKPAPQGKTQGHEDKTSSPPPLPEVEKTTSRSVLDKYLKQTDTTQKDKKALQTIVEQIPEEPSCLAGGCHQDFPQPTTPHFASLGKKCTACHRVNPTHTTADHSDFLLKNDERTLCATCHKDRAGNYASHVGSERPCSSCHNPHGTENSFILRTPRNEINTICFECHDQEEFHFKQPHGPVEMGACTYCHDPHINTGNGLLRKGSQELCLTCHTTIKAELKTSTILHEPLKKGTCTTCHPPHGSNHQAILRESPDTFCFGCHHEIADKYEKSKVKHSALYLEKRCGTCHRPHASMEPKLLNLPEVSLCLNCHQETTSFTSYKPADIKSQITDKEYIHQPIVDGSCTACHEQHGSDFRSLLRAEYPATIYAPYSDTLYALCFDCHDEEGIIEPKTETATQFRNGSTNLHTTHVMIDQKGRTCKACHSPHGSDGPKLINRTGAQFGSWTMSIDFSMNETGGSCSPGCHKPLAYDREAPVEYPREDQVFEKYYIEYQSKN